MSFDPGNTPEREGTGVRLDRLKMRQGHREVSPLNNGKTINAFIAPHANRSPMPSNFDHNNKVTPG